MSSEDIDGFMAQRLEGQVTVTCNATVVGTDSTLIRGNELLFLNIFSFALTPSQEPDVEFSHLTCNVLKH